MPQKTFVLELAFGGRRFASAEKGLRQFAGTLGRNLGDLDPIVKKNVRIMLDTIVTALKRRHRSPFVYGRRMPEGDRTGKLQQRSRDSLRSLERGKSVTGSGDNIQGILRGRASLLVHEEGATIRSRGKLMAIPLEAALTKRGIPRKLKPRDWKNTFVAKSKKGNHIILQRKGRGIIPLYFLTKKVVIPRRLGLVVTVQTAIPLFEDRVFGQLTRALARGL